MTIVAPLGVLKDRIIKAMHIQEKQDLSNPFSDRR